ncbi:MAG: MFS transporter [Phormidesmis sp. RL_2_1]|nr:MFS transporter [Phormidesmis sp. RL_2_1]
MAPMSFYPKNDRLPVVWPAYAIGFFGLFLIKSALMSVILYRYDPGPNAVQLPILVSAAVVGIVAFISRIVGAILQPVAGYCSDRTQGVWGKRRPFLAGSTLPMAISFVLLFKPVITPETTGNSLYLLALLCVFHLAFSLYQVPYLAWLPELATQNQQRVMLAKWLAITSLLGTAAGGAGAPWLIEQYDFGGMTAIVALVSVVTLLLPLMAPEHVAPMSHPPALLVSLQKSWQNVAFRPYVLSVSAAWIATTILGICPPFFAIALLRQNIGFSAWLNLLVLAGAAAGMIGIKPLVKRFGKRKVLQISMVWSGVGLLLLTLASWWIGDSVALWMVLLPVGSVGLAGFFVLPNAMMPDVVEYDLDLGKSAQAVYFGSRGLFVEVSVGLGALIVGLLLSLGRTVDQPLGVQLSLAAAGVFSLVSAGLLSAYPMDK